MSSRSPVKPAGVAVNPYFSPAVRVGNLLFISGMAGIDDQGNVITPGDCAPQAESIMERMKTTLEAAGAGLTDVVKTTTFLTNVDDYAAYNNVRVKYFPEDPPASSTVIVAALVRPGLVVEVEAVAAIPAGS